MMTRRFVVLALAVTGALDGAPPLAVETLAVEDGDRRAAISTGAAPATAVVFLSALCPISNGYLDRLADLHRQFSARGVQFLFVNSNYNEPAADVANHASANRLPFPVWRDAESRLAIRLDAQLTPEVFVFDRQGALRYRGAIDDAPYQAARIRVAGLRLALEALLAGRNPSPAELRGVGCTIKRPKR